MSKPKAKAVRKWVLISVESNGKETMLGFVQSREHGRKEIRESCIPWFYRLARVEIREVTKR